MRPQQSLVKRRSWGLGETDGPIGAAIVSRRRSICKSRDSVARMRRRRYDRPVRIAMLIFIALCAGAIPVPRADARTLSLPDDLTDQAGAGADQSVAERVASTRGLDGAELIKIGDLHEVQNHLLEALPYYRRALAAFRMKKDRRGEATALVKIGRVQERQGHYAEAYSSLHEAMPLLAAEDRAQAQAFLSLGRVSEALGQMAEAERAYQESGTRFLRAQERPGYNESLIRLGGLFIAQGRTADGLASLQKALRDAREREDHAQEITILTAMGDNHMKGDDRGAALALYQEGLRLAEVRRDVRAEAGLRVRLARLYEADDRSAEGATFAWRALALYQSLKDRAMEADTWSLLGSLHQEEGNLPLAVEYYERALALYRALRDQTREAASLANLATIYEAQGLQQQALDTKQQAVRLLQPRP